MPKNILFINKTKAIVLPIGSAMLTAASIVFIANSFFKNFFLIDDAQNAFLGLYKEIGRIVMSGHLPVLTTNIFLGGNLLVDMVSSPFAPQTLLTGILATQIESFCFVASFLAWLNITLVIIGTYWLGRILTLSPSYALLLGFIVATNPVFLYVYTSSWWNFASAFAWFTISFATLLQFRQNQSAAAFLLAVLSLCFLFASAGTHMQFAYGVCLMVVMVVDFYHTRRFDRLAFHTLIGVCAILISAIPLMAEYKVNADLIERFSGFDNSNNLLVPSWGYFLNAFNPFYATYISWFNGYKFLPISFGYIGFISILLFFITNKPHTNTTINYTIVSSLTVVLLVLCFSSSQLGPMRYPFRFIPAWSMMASAWMVFFIQYADFQFSKHKLYQFGGLVFCTALIQLLSAKDAIFESKNIIFFCLFIILCCGLVSYYVKNKDNPKKLTVVLWSFTVFAWIGMLAQTHKPYEYYMAFHPNLTEQITGLVPNIRDAYILGLTPESQHKALDVADLGTGQFLLYGQQSLRTINGYSPVGHSGFQKFLPHNLPWGEFNPHETLKKLCQPSEQLVGIFEYQLMNIGAITVWKTEITPEISTLLNQVGLQVASYPVGERVVITPKQKRIVEGSLTYQSLENTVKFDHPAGMMHEWYTVAQANIERTLVFSRIYWQGYHAVINGTELPVSDYKQTLVKVIIPANSGGIMHFYYEPISWRYTRWSILLGLVLVGLILGKLRLKPTNKH